MKNVYSSTLGFSRMGQDRKLKKLLESYWKGTISQQELAMGGIAVRSSNWDLMDDAGLDIIPVGDFAFYDHILETSVGFKLIPPRFRHIEDFVESYFAMARGVSDDDAQAQTHTRAHAVAPMEMSKWFDTNYHYIVPEFEPDTVFGYDEANKLIHESSTALEFFKKKSHSTLTHFERVRPVLIGPVSYILLGKMSNGDSVETHLESLLESLVPQYCVLLDKLADLGITTFQLDEPFLATTINEQVHRCYHDVYTKLNAHKSPQLSLMLASYFDEIASNVTLIRDLPVDIVHLDMGFSKNWELGTLFDSDKAISLGLVNGRNIWKHDLTRSIETIEEHIKKHPSIIATGKKLILSSSCSLLHCPRDLDDEPALKPEIKDWLAFAKQKIEELSLLTRVCNQRIAHTDSSAEDKKALAENAESIIARKQSPLIHKPDVQARLSTTGSDPKYYTRKSEFAVRKATQSDLGLPLFPTTTIGSFPQTPEIRKTRRLYKKGDVSTDAYQEEMRGHIASTIAFQERLGLDVLVHGEPERNDMVEYFGENFDGFISTQNGWVQSYGSRCVKPPIIYGDLQCQQEITSNWIAYAQSLTKKHVKGMLTGPVTILQWSFVRDDIPRSQVANQIALLIRDEIDALVHKGTRIIQVDEPAFREGLPLRTEKHREYLDWAIAAFKLATCGVEDSIQIHTHMCYSEFNEIFDSIAAMDADVISIEASRSKMELLAAFSQFNYPNDIGPGVYDIHSPRVPSKEEIRDLLTRALKHISREHLWVNPDCGLKTRQWKEVEASLKNMVEVAIEFRSQEHVQ